MPQFTAHDVKRLRDATGAGMMDAKRALTENDGDFEAAASWLREKGLAQAAKRADRESTQGAVAVSVQGDAAAIVELRCETDFVAKSPDFVRLVGELAELVASKGDDAVAERAAEVEALAVTLKENISVGQVTRFVASPDAVLDSYLHVQNERGVNAVLVELAGATPELAHDLAVHVAFGKPRYLTREELPADEVAAERATLEAQTRNEGKPEAAIEKIVEGKLTAFFRDRVLLDQPFAKDEKRTVAQVLGDARVLRFAQVLVGG